MRKGGREENLRLPPLVKMMAGNTLRASRTRIFCLDFGHKLSLPARGFPDSVVRQALTDKENFPINNK